MSIENNRPEDVSKIVKLDWMMCCQYDGRCRSLYEVPSRRITFKFMLTLKRLIIFHDFHFSRMRQRADKKPGWIPGETQKTHQPIFVTA